MNPRYPPVAQRAGHRCEYCLAPEAIFNSLFEVEHIIPAAREGSDAPDNLALACRACNLAKSDHLNATDEETQTVVALFHPRRDQWDDHFRLDAETGVLLGLTPIGRATLNRLQINSSIQVAARQRWIRLQLYP
jgi:hypothetical protein